jgi:hypothetical protein
MAKPIIQCSKGKVSFLWKGVQTTDTNQILMQKGT